MPGKHVRFSKNNTVHTFPLRLPPPPPLTYDNYSPASTSSLLTPPDYPIALPSHNNKYHSRSLRLHHLLERSSSPELLYDIRLPPTQLGSKRRIITPEEFNDSAVSPPSPSITIHHKYLSSTWSIHVKPSGYSQSRAIHYVTVWDVLNAIHSSLRKAISQYDYDHLGNGTRHQSRVKHAYEDRYGLLHPRGSSGYQAEKMGGILRIDFLVEYVKFMGLTPHNVEKGEYTLHTERS